MMKLYITVVILQLFLIKVKIFLSNSEIISFKVRASCLYKR